MYLSVAKVNINNLYKFQIIHILGNSAESKQTKNNDNNIWFQNLRYHDIKTVPYIKTF